MVTNIKNQLVMRKNTTRHIRLLSVALIAVMLFCTSISVFAVNDSYLKAVFIVGPDHNDAFKYVIEKVGEKTANSDDYLVVDGRENSLTPEEIDSRLGGRIDGNTKIFILAHGKNKNNKHYMRIRQKEEGEVTRTSKILKILDKVTEDPIHVFMRSCRGGAANKDVKVLKKGSTLITRGEKDAVSLGGNEIVIEYALEKNDIHARQFFLQNMRRFNITTSYCEHIEGGKRFINIFRPLHGLFLEDAATIGEVLEDQELSFVERYKEKVDIMAGFDMPEIISDIEEQEIIKKYYKYFLYPFVTRKNTKYYKNPDKHAKRNAEPFKFLLQQDIGIDINEAIISGKKSFVYEEGMFEYLEDVGAEVVVNER